MSSSTPPLVFEFASPAAEIAREAGALLRQYYERGVATEYKGDVDLVTEADRASEALIKSRLAAAFPTHGIYGEEGTRDRLTGLKARPLIKMVS
jgi:myo-inositol-1(or 4)-monophosphatase